MARALSARRPLAWGVGCAVVSLLVACGEEPMPVPSATYETEHFLIIDFAQLDDPAIQVVQARLEMEFERVSQALPTFTPPAQLLARIVPGNGTPFVTPAESSLTLWGDSLTLDYLPHQLTHLFTRYVRRAFLEEGLAVYVTELLLPDLPTVHPYRGQTPHAWVSLFEDHGSTIPLLTAFGATNLGYNVNGSTFDASSKAAASPVGWSRRMAGMRGGSCSRWTISPPRWGRTRRSSKACGSRRREAGIPRRSRARRPWGPSGCGRSFGAPGPAGNRWRPGSPAPRRCRTPPPESECGSDRRHKRTRHRQRIVAQAFAGADRRPGRGMDRAPSGVE